MCVRFATIYIIYNQEQWIGFLKKENPYGISQRNKRYGLVPEEA
jgi:hypothetical protein